MGSNAAPFILIFLTFRVFACRV